MKQLTHPPARVLAAYLTAYAATNPVDNPRPLPLGTMPADAYYHHTMPPHTARPVCVCVYDTSGVKDGRHARTGETVVHPGLQFRVRAHNAADAWALVRWVSAALDAIRAVEVEVEGTTYRIAAVTQTGTPLPLPVDQETNLTGYTTNATTTLREA